MKLSIQEQLAAQAIGTEIVKHLSPECLSSMIPETENVALRVLEEIRQVLDDETLNDLECFRKIDAIVNIFHANGLDAARHDW